MKLRRAEIREVRSMGTRRNIRDQSLSLVQWSAIVSFGQMTPEANDGTQGRYFI